MNDFKTWPKLLWVTLIFCFAPAGLSAADEAADGVVALRSLGFFLGVYSPPISGCSGSQRPPQPSAPASGSADVVGVQDGPTVASSSPSVGVSGGAAANAAVPVQAPASKTPYLNLLSHLKIKAQSNIDDSSREEARQVLLRATKILVRDYQDDAVRCGLGGFWSEPLGVKCTKQAFGNELFSLRDQVNRYCQFTSWHDVAENRDLGDTLDAVAKLAVAECVLFMMAAKLEIKEQAVACSAAISPEGVAADLSAQFKANASKTFVGKPSADVPIDQQIKCQAWFLIAGYAKRQLPQTVPANNLGIDFAGCITAAKQKAAGIQQARDADIKDSPTAVFLEEIAKDPLYIPRGVFVFTATPGRKIATGAVLLAIVSAAVGGAVCFKKLFLRYKKWRKTNSKASFWQFVKTLKPEFAKLKQRAKKSPGAKQFSKKIWQQKRTGSVT